MRGVRRPLRRTEVVADSENSTLKVVHSRPTTFVAIIIPGKVLRLVVRSGACWLCKEPVEKTNS